MEIIEAPNCASEGAFPSSIQDTTADFPPESVVEATGLVTLNDKKK